VRFSVLLPTRNGGELLENCIGSVLGQPYREMELVVSDNASTDNTAEILARFESDSRLRVIRQPRPLPVTENWNAALEAASGGYLLQIGDDDYLLPGYFERVDQLLRELGDPDCLTYNGYAFAFPGFAGSATARYADPFFALDERFPGKGELSRALRERLVQEMFGFEFPLHLNLQTTVVARRATERLANGLYKPPFPDFYAMCALLLRAERWFYAEQKLIAIGISPKSFGRTLHRQTQEEGLRYLGISTEFQDRLPGTELINGAYASFVEVQRDYADELKGVELDRGAYVMKQVYSWYLQWRLGWLPNAELVRRMRMLRLRDLPLLLARSTSRLRERRMRRRLRIDRRNAAGEVWVGLEPLPAEIRDNAQFARWLERERGPDSAERAAT
jgi:glycosyltransferase involved in cell wall biosynthesis